MRNAVRLSAFYPANKSTTIKKDREGQPPGLLFLELEAEAGLRSLGSGLLKRLIGIASHAGVHLAELDASATQV